MFPYFPIAPYWSQLFNTRAFWWHPNNISALQYLFSYPSKFNYVHQQCHFVSYSLFNLEVTQTFVSFSVEINLICEPKWKQSMVVWNRQDRRSVGGSVQSVSTISPQCEDSLDVSTWSVFSSITSACTVMHQKLWIICLFLLNHLQCTVWSWVLRDTTVQFQ